MKKYLLAGALALAPFASHAWEVGQVLEEPFEVNLRALMCDEFDPLHSILLALQESDEAGQAAYLIWNNTPGVNGPVCWAGQADYTVRGIADVVENIHLGERVTNGYIIVVSWVDTAQGDTHPGFVLIEERVMDDLFNGRDGEEPKSDT